MKVLNEGRKITDIQLSEFETLIGTTLPSDYKAFLSTYNGGRVEPECFKVSEHPEEVFGIQVFFGINREEKTSCLSWNWEEYSNQLHSELVPIACTDTNDLVCISVQKESFGQIFFWDSMESNMSKAIYYVSHEFSGFMKSLFED